MNFTESEDAFGRRSFNEPIFITNDSAKLLTKLEATEIFGGGDCPEMALTGLNNALKHALPNSLAYVFTDASAKDYYLYNTVIGEIQRKQIKVNFILTGVCSDGKASEGYKVYEKLSGASGGQIYDVQRGDVKNVLLATSKELSSKAEPIESFDSDKAGNSEFDVKVDASISEITVSASGKNINFRVTVGSGTRVWTSDSIALNNIKVSTFEATESSYKVVASADSPYSIRITGKSDLKFEFGFSSKLPSHQAETSIQPIRGQQNILSIFVSNPKLVQNMLEAIIEPLELKHGASASNFTVPLIRTEGNFYSSDSFVIPETIFKIHVRGVDPNGNAIKRSLLPAIEDVTGSMLSVEPIDKLFYNYFVSAPAEIEKDYNTIEAKQNTSIKLNCIVKSLTPVRVSWTFNSKVLYQNSAG